MLTDVAGPAPVGPVHTGRREIWFDGPDGAYLAAAAMRRYLDATVVRDVVLVPGARGPSLDLPAGAVGDRLVQALIRRFGGHVARAGLDADPAEPPPLDDAATP
jgi:hypothetical protein